MFYASGKIRFFFLSLYDVSCFIQGFIVYFVYLLFYVQTFDKWLVWVLNMNVLWLMVINDFSSMSI